MNHWTQDGKTTATGYDRSACAIGIVHVGFGAFHRAHQAVYIDDYMERTGDLAWGIAAVNLRGSEASAFAETQAAKQGYLLKTTSPDGARQFRLVRSHVAFADWSQDASAAEELIAQPSVKAITITVTESGYYLNDDWSLNTDEPSIAAEINGEAPTTIYGFLREALKRRIAAGGAPITILCCDNIRANGKMLKGTFNAYLKAVGEEDVAAWVAENASFPCAMVDRITPRASQELFDEIATLYPGETLAPIHGEAFTQWVIADEFATDRPALEKVGVQMVADVDPYEEAKIRILNGGHTGLAYLGALAGLRTFDEAMAHTDLRKHFDAFEKNDVLPGLNIELPFDRNAYLAEIAARFGNAAIADALERICMDGFSKFPIFVRPTIESCLEQGREPTASYDCIASWVVYARRHAAGTMPIPYHEPHWEALAPLIAPGNEQAFAEEVRIWSDLPKRFEGFVPGVVEAIGRMEARWPA